MQKVSIQIIKNVKKQQVQTNALLNVFVFLHFEL